MGSMTPLPMMDCVVETPTASGISIRLVSMSSNRFSMNRAAGLDILFMAPKGNSTRLTRITFVWSELLPAGCNGFRSRAPVRCFWLPRWDSHRGAIGERIVDGQLAGRRAAVLRRVDLGGEGGLPQVLPIGGRLRVLRFVASFREAVSAEILPDFC